MATFFMKQEEGVEKPLTVTDPETGKKYPVQITKGALQRFANLLEGPDEYSKQFVGNLDEGPI